MWNRAELKEQAKSALSQNYWRCILAGLILSLITGGGSSISVMINSLVNLGLGPSSGHSAGILEGGPSMEVFAVLGMVLAVVMVIGWSIAIVWSYLIALPIAEVGVKRFFMENAYGKAGVSKMFFAFTCGHYWKVAGVLFLQQLYITLWTFLLIIPGIVKSYEYRMVPYLMADCPELGRKDAFRISKEMMAGQKLDTFILDLSFIGWEMLSGLTFGILSIFYVIPYRHATEAELFLELKKQYFAGKNDQ